MICEDKVKLFVFSKKGFCQALTLVYEKINGKGIGC